MSDFDWRAMASDDIDGVVTVARIAFPDHYEDRTCFEERFGLYPQGCFVLANGAEIGGYLIAYPWPAGSIPPLNSPLGILPGDRSAFYLHDLALRPDRRGGGYSRPVVEKLMRHLHGIKAKTLALVSVNESAGYWQRLGFEPCNDVPVIAAKLVSYGPDAIYMVRQV